MKNELDLRKLRASISSLRNNYRKPVLYPALYVSKKQTEDQKLEKKNFIIEKKSNVNVTIFLVIKENACYHSDFA